MIPTPRSTFSPILSLVVALGLATAASAAGNTPRVERRSDSLLIRFRDSAPSANRDAHRKAYKATKARDFGKLVSGLESWKLPKGAALDGILEALNADPDVLYAEPNYVQHIVATPNDPRYGELWGLHNTGQNAGMVDADIDAPEAWDITTGSSDIVVGIIDTGIDWTHPDLAANIWTNPGEIAGNGVDDDGNGYVDDVHGWNAITGTGNAMDDNDHGSHCAGTIGGTGNNGGGVVGVNWNVKMMALKFLSASGSGSTDDAIESINYAVAQKNRGVNIRVLSNSWGGGGFSQAVLDAINAAAAADILFTAAAGNSTVNNDTSPHYPSSYNAPNVVAVASTTRTDGISSFSNYGATSVDLGAPGTDILSTTRGNTYQVFSGTSMATPHVSGAAALMLAVNPTLTYAEIKQVLMNTVDPISSLNGKTVTGGRLNVYRAVSSLGPPQPTFRVSVSPSSATVSQGQSASFTVSTASVAGFTGDVTLSLSSVPALAGATASFSPSSVPAGGASTLTISTSTGTATGTYNVTITGTSGTITKTTSLSFTVDPEGTVTVSYANPSVISILDNNTSGITSTINVPDSLGILSLSVTVDITHTYIGDLEVSVIAPSGTTAILHNRGGGSTDNLHQTYSVTAFNGQNTQGAWRLKVRDLASVDVGTLDNWRLTIKGAPSAPPPPDTSAPSVAITSPANGATLSGTVSVTATASDNRAVSEVRFYADGGLIGTDTSSPYSVSWNATGAGAGSHTLTAQASDAAGNVGNAAALNVTVSLDTTPPTISAVSTSSITPTSAVISWTTNEEADTQVQYGTTTSYGASTPLDANLVTSHRVTLTGLLKNTRYNYRVRSMDAAGNVSFSGNFTFTTPRK
ncbi:MAG TPA: S8 family serine peptidase [Myxococcaceae bacterium]|nr:S8 family serine peptidase [Myxococcaceae bacterium]